MNGLFECRWKAVYDNEKDEAFSKAARIAKLKNGNINAKWKITDHGSSKNKTDNGEIGYSIISVVEPEWHGSATEKEIKSKRYRFKKELIEELERYKRDNDI